MQGMSCCQARSERAAISSLRKKLASAAIGKLLCALHFFQEGFCPMTSRAALSRTSVTNSAKSRSSRRTSPLSSFNLTAQTVAQEVPSRQAELFYLQKQVQFQTLMAIVLEDGERIEGCIEWYDRQSFKVRGQTKVLVYKSAVKYMYKLGS
jgi:sRNA-binding regulator protein Hfq